MNRKPFDIGRLMERLDGDEKPLREMVRLFLINIPRMVAESRSAVENENRVTSANLAHTVKDSCATFCAFAMRDIPRETERAAEEKNSARVQSLLSQIEEGFRILRQFLVESGFQKAIVAPKAGLIP